jgi:hypothetical protein
MKPLAIASALALCVAGCGGPSPQTNVRAFCAAQANHDPDVERIRMIGAGAPFYADEHQIELQAKLHAAEQKCLFAHGAAPPGGVQPYDQRWYSHDPFDWLF